MNNIKSIFKKHIWVIMLLSLFSKLNSQIVRCELENRSNKYKLKVNVYISDSPNLYMTYYSYILKKNYYELYDRQKVYDFVCNTEGLYFKQRYYDSCHLERFNCEGILVKQFSNHYFEFWFKTNNSINLKDYYFALRIFDRCENSGEIIFISLADPNVEIRKPISSMLEYVTPN